MCVCVRGVTGGRDEGCVGGMRGVCVCVGIDVSHGVCVCVCVSTCIV